MLDNYFHFTDEQDDMNDNPEEAVSFFDSFETVKELGIDESTEQAIQDIIATLPGTERDVLSLQFGIHGAEVDVADVGKLLDLSEEEIEKHRQEAIKLLQCNPKLKQLHNELA